MPGWGAQNPARGSRKTSWRKRWLQRGGKIPGAKCGWGWWSPDARVLWATPSSSLALTAPPCLLWNSRSHSPWHAHPGWIVVSVETDSASGQGWLGSRGGRVRSSLSYVGKEVRCVRFKPRTAVSPPAGVHHLERALCLHFLPPAPGRVWGVGWLAGGGEGMRPQWMGEVLGG